MSDRHHNPADHHYNTRSFSARRLGPGLYLQPSADGKLFGLVIQRDNSDDFEHHSHPTFVWWEWYAVYAREFFQQWPDGLAADGGGHGSLAWFAAHSKRRGPYQLRREAVTAFLEWSHPDARARRKALARAKSSGSSPPAA